VRITRMEMNSRSISRIELMPARHLYLLARFPFPFQHGMQRLSWLVGHVEI
jgi:hypothetical protein